MALDRGMGRPRLGRLRPCIHSPPVQLGTVMSKQQTASRNPVCIQVSRRSCKAASSSPDACPASQAGMHVEHGCTDMDTHDPLHICT